MKNKSILIVDDERTNLDVLVEFLCSDYEITVALNGKKALELIEKNEINLILLDIVMPDISGFEVCEILKSQTHTKDIPIIFITANTDEASIEKAYEIGGIDFISKPFKPMELLAKIKREFRLQEMQDELKLLASTDYMTKLYNRRYFSTTAEHIFELSRREKKDLFLIMLDIDDFKLVNDTYGHKVGDDVIIALANTLIKKQRKSDIICRYGGEEFVLLLANTSLDGAKIVAENIRVDAQSSMLSLENNKILNYTVSLGVSQVDVHNESNIEIALKRADAALYEAKESGKNKVCFKSIKDNV